ncbi:MAG: AEC family transporter [Lachnospiraceae bacterium]|nr:AEC family transporter [Lachnospiraceae bacterium]
MDISIILQQMGVICLLVAIGIILEKRGVVDTLSSKKLSAIVVDVCNPALILASILGGNITAGHKDLIYAAVLGIAFYALLVILGHLIPRLLRVAPDKRKFYNLMCVYTNTGFLGIPIAKAILPPNAIIYVIVINIFYSLLFYTHGLATLGPGPNEEGRGVNPLRQLLNPGTIMAVISLLVFWFGISLPPILANTAEYVGNATVFLSMVLLGASIARSDLLASLKDLRIWIFIALRLVFLPIVIVLILHAVSFDKTATLAMCLMAAVPVGNLPMITAEKKGMDTSILSSAIAVTTAVSIVTITLLISVATAVL